MVLGRQRRLHVGQQARQLARVLVVARPLDAPCATSAARASIVLVGVAHAARLQRLQRALGPLAAVDARRPEEHDRVLDLLVLEAAQRLEVLGQDADRPRLVALEKLRVQVRERLLRHNVVNLPSHRAIIRASAGRHDAAPRGAAHAVDISIVIAAAPGRVLKAFFDADALGAWWQVATSVTTPRPLGPYALEWTPTDFRDEVLGRLGGVFRGTVMQFDPAQRLLRRRLLLAAARRRSDWADGARGQLRAGRRGRRVGTRVRVRQSGFEESASLAPLLRGRRPRVGTRARVAEGAARESDGPLQPDVLVRRVRAGWTHAAGGGTSQREQVRKSGTDQPPAPARIATPAYVTGPGGAGTDARAASEVARRLASSSCEALLSLRHCPPVVGLEQRLQEKRQVPEQRLLGA